MGYTEQSFPLRLGGNIKTGYVFAPVEMDVHLQTVQPEGENILLNMNKATGICITCMSREVAF